MHYFSFPLILILPRVFLDLKSIHTLKDAEIDGENKHFCWVDSERQQTVDLIRTAIYNGK
jgi:hypothetical protein